MSGCLVTVRLSARSESVPRVRSHVDELARSGVFPTASSTPRRWPPVSGQPGCGPLPAAQTGSASCASNARAAYCCRKSPRGVPGKREPLDGDVTGRGALLVDAGTLAWGVRERTGAGRAVWARLAAS